MKNKQALQGARRLFVWQLMITLLIAGIASLISGNLGAQSAVLAGIASAVPNAIFAKKMFQYQGARAAKQIINSFYKGEMLKIVLSIVLFATIFIFFKIVPLIFFLTYIAVQMVVWFVPLIFANKQNRPESD